jgi:arginine/lysine/ornithine decarboxylase
MPFAAAVGRISVETICVYPPGIPLIIPGQVRRAGKAWGNHVLTLLGVTMFFIARW